MKKITAWVNNQWANKGSTGKITVVGVVAGLGIAIAYFVFKMGKKKGKWS